MKPATESPECVQAWKDIKLLDKDLNWYDLFRKTYTKSKSTLLLQDAPIEDRMKTVQVGNETKTYKQGFTFSEYTPWAKHIVRSESSQALLGAFMSDYVNRADVRRALNIPDTLPAWEQCNSFVSDNYKLQYEGSMWIYKILKQYNYKILFFSGDTDGAVPTYGSRQWIDSLQMPVKEEWRQWITDDQVSGYIIRYEGLDFATIHGVGHMAPQWKRKEVTKLFTNWIHDEPIQ